MNLKVKQCFLQACLNHGSLEVAEALKMLAPICEKLNCEAPTNIDGLKELVEQLNRDLAEYNQCLTIINHSIVNKEFIVFSVTVEMDVSKQQAHLSDTDRYVFTKLVEALVEEERYSLEMGAMYSILFDAKSSQRQKAHLRDLFEMWKNQGYFSEVQNFLYFGPRLLVEFPTYLKKNYPSEVQDCTLCHRIVLWDVKCSHCNAKVHRDCIRHYLAKTSNCPACNKIWNTRLSVTPE